MSKEPAVYTLEEIVNDYNSLTYISLNEFIKTLTRPKPVFKEGEVIAYKDNSIDGPYHKYARHMKGIDEHLTHTTFRHLTLSEMPQAVTDLRTYVKTRVDLFGDTSIAISKLKAFDAVIKP